MIIAITIAALLILTLIIGKVNLSIRFHKQVKELFAHSKDISDKKFSYQQLTGLPQPVQRYFKHVLKDGQPYISYASLTHDGQFKTGENNGWVNIKGEQYFTAEKPGFIWKGTTAMFTARDMYINNKGRLIVSLFSLYNILDGTGEKYNQGELLRWLAENVWFPTNLLPGKNLLWTAIDNLSAKLTFNYNGLSLFYIVTFNDTGEITRVETQRYMGEENLETWIGEFTDYREMNGVVVPTTIEAIWKLEKGDLSYARFHVKKIVYNKPERFRAK